VDVHATNLDMNEYSHVIIDGVDEGGGGIKHYGQGFVHFSLPEEVLKRQGTHKIQVKTRAGISNSYDITIGKPQSPRKFAGSHGTVGSNQLPTAKYPKLPLGPMGRKGITASRHASLPPNGNGRGGFESDGGRGHRIAHPGTASMRPVAKLKMPANVLVLRETYRVDQSCRNTQQLIVFNVTLRNDGGPLATHKWSLFATEDGGADLSSGDIWVPSLAPGAEARVSIPVPVPKSHIGQLPGAHRIELIALDNSTGHKTTTPLRPIILSRGICQPKIRVGSPRLNAHAGGAMQAKPMIPTHRLSLPAER
jgi:hypothetical protein